MLALLANSNVTGNTSRGLGQRVTVIVTLIACILKTRSSQAQHTKSFGIIINGTGKTPSRPLSNETQICFELFFTKGSYGFTRFICYMESIGGCWLSYRESVFASIVYLLSSTGKWWKTISGYFVRLLLQLGAAQHWQFAIQRRADAIVYSLARLNLDGVSGCGITRYREELRIFVKL